MTQAIQRGFINAVPVVRPQRVVEIDNDETGKLLELLDYLDRLALHLLQVFHFLLVWSLTRMAPELRRKKISLRSKKSLKRRRLHGSVCGEGVNSFLLLWTPHFLGTSKRGRYLAAGRFFVVFHCHLFSLVLHFLI